jgi:hypothetical protein
MVSVWYKESTGLPERHGEAVPQSAGSSAAVGVLAQERVALMTLAGEPRTPKRSKATTGYGHERSERDTKDVTIGLRGARPAPWRG